MDSVINTPGEKNPLRHAYILPNQSNVCKPKHLRNRPMASMYTVDYRMFIS